MRYDELNIQLNNQQLSEIQIHLKNIQSIRGQIIIDKSTFNTCHFSFYQLSIEQLDILFKANTFVNCTFDIKDCEFYNGKTVFTGCHFENCQISMSGNKFYHKYLDVRSISGLDELIFLKCIFHSYTNFEQSDIQKIIFIHCMFENDLDLRLKACHELVIEECKISRLLNLNFLDPSSIYSLNVFDSINLGQILIDWNKHRVKEMIKNNRFHYQLKDNDHLVVIPVTNNFYAKQFILLKENFRKQGKFAYEDQAYYEYRQHIENKNLYSIIGGMIGQYGTNPISILYFMIKVIITFSILFYLIEAESLRITSYVKYLYFSGITFFTIGYSDQLITTNISRVLALTEGFFGVFLMAYFTGSFIRKVLR